LSPASKKTEQVRRARPSLLQQGEKENRPAEGKRHEVRTSSHRTHDAIDEERGTFYCEGRKKPGKGPASAGLLKVCLLGGKGIAIRCTPRHKQEEVVAFFPGRKKRGNCRQTSSASRRQGGRPDSGIKGLDGRLVLTNITGRGRKTTLNAEAGKKEEIPNMA